MTRSADIHLLSFLKHHTDDLVLLCEPEFVADLHYCGRFRHEPADLAFPIEVLEGETSKTLQGRNEAPDGAPLHIVAAPDDERGRVAFLSRLHPRLRFVGLAERVVPAVLALDWSRVFDDTDETAPLPADLKALVMIATPRSGSSHVCDILEGLGCGQPREHLRDPVIELFASGYRFDKTRSLRNFIRFSAHNGWFATKLITHFLEDFLNASNLTELEALQSFGLPLYPILVSREDRVMQAISGELAARRGIWHVTDDKTAARLKESEEIPYDFLRILKRYLGYEAQAACYQAWKGLLPEKPLELIFERDVVDYGVLIDRLTHYLGIEPPAADAAPIAGRRRIGSEINDRFKAMFIDDFIKTFKVPPRTFSVDLPAKRSALVARYGRRQRDRNPGVPTENSESPAI